MNTLDRDTVMSSWRAWISYDRHDDAPRWLAWIWTLLFAAFIAFFFTLLGFVVSASNSATWLNLGLWFTWYGRNFIVSLTISVLIHLLFELGRRTIATPRVVHRWAPWRRTLYFAGVPMLSTLIGWPLGVYFAGQKLLFWFGNRNAQPVILGSVLFALMLTFIIHHFFAAKTRQYQAERNATEAQLRLLQGQIEPHFLFNTLANVQALIDVDAPKAKAMLEAFTDYLRGSLGSLRGAHSTLGQECAMAESYLLLLRTRMEDRLAFSVDVDPALHAARLPPLLLQPLVENAIHHGLEPKLEGGRVRLTARRDGDDLVLTVADDGLGFDAVAKRPGNGVALSNLRERLAARYGRQANLTLADSHPGTVATIRLPFETEAP